MIKRKRSKYILTDEDFERYVRILNDDSADLLIAECWNFLQHLESTYQVHDFWLSDLVPRPIEMHEQPHFFDEPSDHASRAFIEILKRVLYSKEGDSHDKKEAWGRLKDYCWRQIKRIRNETYTSDKQKLMVRITLTFFLYELALAAIQKKEKDYETCAVAYLQLAEFADEIFATFGDIPDAMKGFKGLAKPVEAIINIESRIGDRNSSLSVSHPKQVAVYARAMALAEDNEPCLILGETGTGKESVARVMHEFSHRKENVFWAVNCGGFTDSLFNSEIQGVYGKGATDIGTRLGAFLTACGREIEDTRIGYYVDRNQKKEPIKFKPLHGSAKKPLDEQLGDLAGTLFFDEINSLFEHHQAALLRIIQENEVQVVGEDKKRPFRLKLVCASNANIVSLVQNGKFREDLYHRVARGIIELPPLRDLKDSLGEIVERQVPMISLRIGLTETPSVKASTINKLRQYDWPGNLRELENVIYRGLKSMQVENEMSLLPRHIEMFVKESQNGESFSFQGLTHAEVEKNYLDFIIKQAGGNKSQAAREAQIERNKFQRMLKRYGLH